MKGRGFKKIVRNEESKGKKGDKKDVMSSRKSVRNVNRIFKNVAENARKTVRKEENKGKRDDKKDVTSLSRGVKGVRNEESKGRKGDKKGKVNAEIGVVPSLVKDRAANVAVKVEASKAWTGKEVVKAEVSRE